MGCRFRGHDLGHIGRRAALAALLATTATATLANAARAQSGFDVPAGPLSRALAAFGSQSGTQLSYEASIVAGKTSPGIRGAASREQALSQILQASGLVYSFTESGNVLITDAVSAAHAPADGATLLGQITVASGGRDAVSGSGFQGTPDWVYAAPASVSVVSREAIQNSSARNAADTLDTVAGVLTNRSESQKPGLAVNVRGLQDMNRVTTSIDGARQNFQRAGHGSYQQVFVDTSFIRSIEVEKGAVTGVGGAGTLGGMVNFRTVEADDILTPEKNWGVELNGTTGTNAFKFDGSAIAAVRLADGLSVLGGVSGKNIGDYRIGSNGDLVLPGNGNTIVDDRMLYSRNEAVNTLLKAEWQATNDLNVQASWLRYEADGAQGGNLWGSPRRDEEHYVNNTLTGVVKYDPGSELVDLTARLWFNDTSNDEQRGYVGGAEPVTYGMRSFGGSLENTSRIALNLGDLALHYGGEAFHDEGRTETADLEVPGGPDNHYGFGGMNPSGKRWMASGFLNATLQHEDWLTLNGGLRYDHYGLSGSTVYQNQRIVVTPPENCLQWQDMDGDGTPDPNGLWIGTDGNIYYEPGPDREFVPPTCDRWERPGGNETVYDRFPVNVDQNGGAWLPSATLAVKPLDWLQPFVSYSRTYRPPTITETLISGGHPFVPFENAPNPNLRPERGETWELGANVEQDGIFTSDDTLRVKTVFFNRNIEDYISMGHIWSEAANRLYTTHVNLDGTTTIRGLELEASYDLGYAYLGASYTHIKTDFADGYTLVTPPGEDLTGNQPPRPPVLFVPPENKFTLDAGVRLFERRLVLGGRATYVSETKPRFGQLVGAYFNDSYAVYDLYGSWAFSDTVKLRFAVNNLTDVKYVPALGTNAYPAPGRTATASLSLRF